MRPTPKKPRLDIDENQNHQIYNSNLGPAGQENNLKRNLLEDSNDESKIEEISLKELHMRIEDLIDKQLVSNDYLEGVFQVIKDTLEAALKFDRFQNEEEYQKHLITGQELISLLSKITDQLDKDALRKSLSFVNINFNTILHVLSEFGESDDLLNLLRFLASVDIEFAKGFIEYANGNDRRNVVHNIFEFGKIGAARDFLDFLVKTFNDKFYVRNLLRARAYSKSDDGMKSPKVIMEYTPLHLLAFSRKKGVVGIEELLRLLDWFYYNMDYETIVEMLTLEDSDKWNVMHYFTRFTKDSKSFILLLEWLNGNVKFEFVRSFLKLPVSEGITPLQLQSKASTDPGPTAELLQWLNRHFLNFELKHLIKATNRDYVNTLLGSLCHPDYLKKASELLKWVNIYFDRNVASDLLQNYQKALLELIENHQNLDSFIEFIQFVGANYNSNVFLTFTFYNDKFGMNFLHKIASNNKNLNYTRKFIEILLKQVDKKMVYRYLISQDFRKNNFMHHLFSKVENIEEIEPFLEWLIDTFEFEFMEQLLKEQNNVGFIPLHLLIYNDARDSLMGFEDVLRWKRRALGPNYLLEIIQIRTIEKWQLFDFIARYKDDTASLINIFNWLKKELTPNQFKSIFEKPIDWSILHFIFRYNSNEDNVKSFLNWLLTTFDLKFVTNLFQMRSTTALECLADNRSLSFIEIMEYLEISASLNFVLDLIQFIMKKQQNSIVNIMLNGMESKGEFKEIIEWMDRKFPNVLKDMLKFKDGDGKTALELAKVKSVDFRMLLEKYMKKYGLM